MAPSQFRKLQDKHILIIGGTSGIGFSVAEASLADGAHVTVSSSSPDKVSKTVSKLTADYPDRKVQGFPCDVSSPTIEDDLEALFQAAEATQGQLNHVVMTAGRFPGVHPVESISAETIHKVADNRLVATVMLGKVAARHLPKDNSSSVVFTNGAVTEQPSKGFAVMAYVAGGLQTLARALAVELAPVRVNCVRPGVVETPMMEAFGKDVKNKLKALVQSKLPTGQVGQPEDVAETYLWLMKDKNVTGTLAASDGGSTLVSLRS